MTEIISAIALALVSWETAAVQEEPVPMQFFEVRAAQPRDTFKESNTDMIRFNRQNNVECFETPYGNAEVYMVASLCGEPLDVEGLNVSEVIPLTQEEYCARSAEIVPGSLQRALSWEACE